MIVMDDFILKKVKNVEKGEEECSYNPFLILPFLLIDLKISG